MVFGCMIVFGLKFIIPKVSNKLRQFVKVCFFNLELLKQIFQDAASFAAFANVRYVA